MKSKNNSKLKLTTLAMAQIAVCTALLCVLSPLAIPLPIPVPFTLQVLVVVLIALILKPVYALIAQLLYTLLGIVGLPVFSGGKSGIGAVLSPTGGFIIGFIFAAFFVSLLNSKLKIKNPFARHLVASIAAGIRDRDVYGLCPSRSAERDSDAHLGIYPDRPRKMRYRLTPCRANQQSPEQDLKSSCDSLQNRRITVFLFKKSRSYLKAIDKS